MSTVAHVFYLDRQLFSSLDRFSIIEFNPYDGRVNSFWKCSSAVRLLFPSGIISAFTFQCVPFFGIRI